MKQTSNGYARDKGSILIEALLSVVILSVSITLIIQSMTSSLRATAYAADYTNASIFLENQLAGYLVGKIVEPGMNTQVEGEDVFEGYSFGLESQQESQTAAESNLTNIEAYVQWQSGSKKNKLGIATYLMGQANEK